MTTIIDAQDYNYISEFLEDLPDNAYLNKVLTGCGGSTVALTNKKNYVIAVPFVSLIIAKNHIHPNTCPVYSDIWDSDIQEYLARTDIDYKKFLVTYDSLARLLKFINPSEYKILIDEAHKLLDSASFRTNAIETVLENYQKFNSYCFMTATPVKDKYQLPELKLIPKYEIKWNNITPVNITYTKLKKDLNATVASIVIKHIKGEYEGNPYILLNSVTSIIDIISILQAAGYNDASLYKILCADTESNEVKITRELGSNYAISFSFLKSKKITFCTSCAFEGIDLYDEDGVTYIVSDGNKEHTKYDILTQIPQIIGRLRDSKFKNIINLVFTPSYYFNYTSIEEFSKEVLRQLDLAKPVVDIFNNSDNELIKETLLRGSVTNPYILDRNGSMKVNTSVWYNEMHHYEIVNSNYFYKEFDRKVINNIPHNFIRNKEEIQIDGLTKLRLAKKPSFKSMCLDYEKAVEQGNTSSVSEVELHFPIIAEAYEKLGSTKIKALKYRQSDIKKELITVSKLEDSTKIVKLLNIRVGELVDRKELKLRLQSIYNELAIKKIAKATDIKNWFTVEEFAKKLDGTTAHYFKIISCNVKF